MLWLLLGCFTHCVLFYGVLEDRGVSGSQAHVVLLAVVTDGSPVASRFLGNNGRNCLVSQLLTQSLSEGVLGTGCAAQCMPIKCFVRAHTPTQTGTETLQEA